MKLRPVHFSLRSIAAAGFATLLASASGLFLAITPAAAAADGVSAISGFAVGTLNAPFATNTVNQAGSNISFSIPSAVTTGDTITLQVAPHSSGNCATSASDFVGFNNTGPIAANATGTNAPTFTTSFSTAASDPPACSSLKDVMVLHVTNNGGTGPFTVTISLLAYNVGAAADPGTINIGISAATASATTTTYFSVTGVPTGNTSPPSDASVVARSATATANNPVATVTNGGGTGTISNIVITEVSAAAVTGSLCIVPATTPLTPTTFTFTGVGTTTFSGGTGAVVGASSIIGGTSLQVLITTPSATAGIFTITGATVATSGGITGPAAVVITSGGSGCGSAVTGVASGLVVFGVAPTLSPAIAGTDADATAIAEMATSYPPPSNCPASHAVVLATDQSFPDALAASYLAGHLGTGILLTPQANLSAETQTALQNEGVTSVYVVGGTLAISANTISQVNATPAYTCGGVSAGTLTGSHIAVVQTLFGQTQYDTAQQIAAFPGAGSVHSFNLSGAYSGQYNNTAGNESSSPVTSGALRTAIVATGASFQDAAGASVLAFNNQFPMVLTDPNALSTQAQTTLSALGIQQVIVLGGTLAVSAADVTSIQGMGISVIRVAGADATDTAQELATLELQSTTSNAGLGWSTAWGHVILVARGDFFSDALAGAVLAANGHTTPLLLTENPSTVGAPLTGFLNQGGSAAGIDGLGAVGNIQTIQPLGGSLALFFSTLTAMAGAVAAG